MDHATVSECAVALARAGLNSLSLIGEAFAVDNLAMEPAPFWQAKIDGHLPGGRSIQVKTKGPTKDGTLPRESEFYPDVHRYQFDVILFVQLDVTLAVWRFALLTADDAKRWIRSQSQASCNDSGKGAWMRLETLTSNSLWQYAPAAGA